MANTKKKKAAVKKAAKKAVKKVVPKKGAIAARNSKDKYAKLRQEAYKYYTEHNLEQKAIAAILHLPEKTISLWKQEDNWEEDRVSMLLSPEKRIRNTLIAYDNLLKTINGRPSPNNVPTSSETDQLNKLADAANKLKSEIQKGHISEVGKMYIDYNLRTYGKEVAIEHADRWNEFFMSL